MDEKINILIVDDLPEKLLVFESILEELQQNLVLVRSGREALQQILERDFAVILLDVNMPDMDGFETAKLIRQYRRTKQTPIVFITAYMDDIQSMQGYALGAVDYISTPVVPEVLRSKVKVFVDLYHMHMQLQRQAEEREALARAEAARDAAELSKRRADLLADASHILTRSLDIDAIINGLLIFVVPQLAAIGMVILINERRAVTRTLAYCAQDYRRGDVSELSEPLRDAIACIEIDDDLLELADAGDVQLMRGDTSQHLALGATKLLPLFARRKLIGVIALARGDAQEINDSASAIDDIGMLKEIAGRAAIAIDNALLYRAIRDGDRHKNEFLAMLSHELRNPLAPIRNAVHILQAQPSRDERTRWATEVISRQVEHMAHLMNDLLDVSRIARGTVVIEQRKVMLGDVIARSVEASGPQLEARRHKLKVELPAFAVEVQGDPVRLAQIFSNLLNNAIKYSPDQSDIWIRAVYRDEQVDISVRDNGHGIDAEFMPHIFDLFAQGDKSIERTQSGLGVGLTLVKHLTALHHGSIEAKSGGIGKGAEFIVTLPAKRIDDCAEPDSVPTIMPEPATAGCRVLVVDDLKESAHSMKMLLELSGYEVEAVYDGPAALAAVSKFDPDVVLLDIGLPGMDGFEVARQLHQRVAAVPCIIALTGYGQEADHAKSKEAGFDAHIVKPADIDKLLAMIASYCAERVKRSQQIRHAYK